MHMIVSWCLPGWPREGSITPSRNVCDALTAVPGVTTPGRLYSPVQTLPGPHKLMVWSGSQTWDTGLGGWLMFAVFHQAPPDRGPIPRADNSTQHGPLGPSVPHRASKAGRPETVCEHETKTRGCEGLTPHDSVVAHQLNSESSGTLESRHTTRQRRDVCRP